jgi:4-alpha-glucanotransferase
MDGLSERAARCGIETEFWDAFGQHRTVEPQVLARFLEALGTGVPEGERLLPHTIVLRGDCERRIALPASVRRLRFEILSDHVIAEGDADAPVITLPPDLSVGVFRLRVMVTDPTPVAADTTLILCPREAFQGGSIAPERMWALAVQLYGVRSRCNWGHGDFSDLAALIDLAADCGASGIGLNPLHALFDDRASETSPYFPSSRLFLNPLYIDVEAVPEFPGVEAAGLRALIDQLRDTTLVDYERVADAKMRALRLAFEAFRRDRSAERRVELDDFRQAQGNRLLRFACFEVLRRRHEGPWWNWPAEWRRHDDAALAELRRADDDEVGFFEFLQWIAHEQLDRCRERARKRGMPMGLYLDIAVGVRSDGFDAWCDQDAVIAGMAVGAPPDMLNTRGQDWGLAGFNPVSLDREQFLPFRQMLHASMRYAGAIRLDHVLGLKRLYMIPHGMSPQHGAYIRFPFEALLAVTALLGVEHRCIVIGEDLGTVPENFRETLADWGLWSYQVMMFERTGQGDFVPPERYRRNALVSFNTHDLPTFVGWHDQRDLATKRSLDIDPGETGEQRHRAVKALRRTVGHQGDQAIDYPAVARHLAHTPSRLLVISLEDVLGVAEQVNLPGTMNEHPNWRHRLPLALDDFGRHDGLRAIADIMRSAGRSFRSR